MAKSRHQVLLWRKRLTVTTTITPDTADSLLVMHHTALVTTFIFLSQVKKLKLR